MKLSKIMRAFIVIAAALIAAMCFAACGDSSSSDSASESSASQDDGVLYTVNGADIKSVDLRMVGETPNLQIVFANNTASDVDVDCSQFSVKLSDGTVVKNMANNRTMTANTPHIQQTFTLASDKGIKTGDTVEIYYGDKLLDTVEVSAF